MPKYKVLVIQNTRRCAEVEVDASSKKLALEQATSIAARDQKIFEGPGFSTTWESSWAREVE
jgi:hypothetical protein